MYSGIENNLQWKDQGKQTEVGWSGIHERGDLCRKVSDGYERGKEREVEKKVAGPQPRRSREH